MIYFDWEKIYIIFSTKYYATISLAYSNLLLFLLFLNKSQFKNQT